MASKTKTITLDLDAYRRLKAVQRPRESFSQTVKRVIRPPFDVEAYGARLREVSLSEEAMEAIEEHVRRRRQPSQRSR